MDVDFKRKIKFATIFTICTLNFSLLFSFYPLIKFYGIGINGCSAPLGKWIKKYTNESASLAIGDVGAIPYYAGIRTIDIYPEGTQDVHLYNNPEDVDYIFDQNITFLILKDPYFDYVTIDIRFYNNYRFICYALFFLNQGL